MAKLKAATRNKLPDSAFALPSQRKYPIKKLVNGKLVADPAHAANAKSRATQQAGKSISASTAASIKAKANRALGKTGGTLDNPGHQSTNPATKTIQGGMPNITWR